MSHPTPDPTLTPAYCARRAAESLTRVGNAADAGYAQALVAAADSWMNLGQLVGDRPDIWSPRPVAVINLTDPAADDAAAHVVNYVRDEVRRRGGTP